MNNAGYIFGGKDMPKSPQELARMREMAQTLAVRQASHAPKNVGEGLSAIGQALIYRSMIDDAAKAEKAGNASSAATMGELMPLINGGGAPSPAIKPPAGPSIPPEALNPAAMSEAPAPMSGGTLAAPIQPVAADPNAPRGLRNNNPLNIEAGNFTQGQPGFTGSDGRFAKFESIDQGIGAADALLQSYAGKGINTVGGIVNRWAPPSDNNPTNVYAATVAKAIGVDPNAPIDMADPTIRRKIIGAMAQFENGKPLPQIASNDPNFMPAMMSPEPAMPPQPMQPGPTALAFNGQPQNNPLAAPPQGGMQPFTSPQNMQTVQTKPAQLPIAGQPPQAAPQSQAGGPSPTVEQLMKAAQNPWLSSGQQAIVKSLLEKKLKEQDPTHQLEAQLKQEQLKKLQNPGTPDAVRALQERANLAGLKPGTPEYSSFMTNGGRGPMVNIDQKQEGEYEKAMGKQFAEANMKIIEAAGSARGKIATLDRLGSLLKDPSIYTGAGGQGVLELKRLGKAIGVDVGDVGPAEAAKSISSQFALELRNPSGGAGMPGAMSDKDREFLQSMVPGLGQNQQGNGLIIDYMKRVAQRSVDVERLRQKYVRKNGRINEGFYNELADWSDANPIFTEADMKAAATPAAPTGGASIDDLLRRYGGTK